MALLGDWNKLRFNTSGPVSASNDPNKNRLRMGANTSTQLQNESYNPTAREDIFNPNSVNTASQQAEQEALKAFSAARQGLGAQQDVTRQKLAEDLARTGAATGGFGGATLKLRQKAITEAERGFGADQASLAAQQAQTMSGLKEAQAGRAMQMSQLRLQDKEFQDTMKYQWNQLAEDKRTNIINASIALKDAGFLDKNFDELLNLWTSGFANLYPGRLPQPTSAARIAAAKSKSDKQKVGEALARL